MTGACSPATSTERRDHLERLAERLRCDPAAVEEAHPVGDFPREPHLVILPNRLSGGNPAAAWALSYA